MKGIYVSANFGIIDLKIEARKEDLRTVGLKPTETIDDSIKSLRWLRNTIERSINIEFRDIIFEAEN